MSGYVTRIDGKIKWLCATPECAISHLGLVLAGTDRVISDALLTELNSAKELTFKGEDGAQVTISQVG